MKLSLQAASLAKFVVSFNGEHELVDGKETPASLRLNGEESSQRRFLLKEIERINTTAKPALEALVLIYNERLAQKRIILEGANPKSEDEVEVEYLNRMNAILTNDEELKQLLVSLTEDNKNIISEIHDLDLQPKVVEFLKKYFLKYGDSAGFLSGDDEFVAELNVALGL